MQVTDAPVEDIDFDWTNMNGRRIATRLPKGFFKAYHTAITNHKKYVDYWTDGGNRIVAKITEDGHLDFIVNPEPGMVLDDW